MSTNETKHMSETETYIKIEHNNYMDIGNVSKRLDLIR